MPQVETGCGWLRNVTLRLRRRPKGTEQGARQGSRDGQYPGSAVGDDAGRSEAMIKQADKLLCESWNERMWSDGEPIDPSAAIDQAVNGGFPGLEIRCARCKLRATSISRR